MIGKGTELLGDKVISSTWCLLPLLTQVDGCVADC